MTVDTLHNSFLIDKNNERSRFNKALDSLGSACYAEALDYLGGAAW